MGCLNEVSEQDALMEDAFHSYMEAVYGDLTELGLSEEAAFRVIFETADALAARGVIPNLPDEHEFLEMGRWVVRAQDAGYHKLALVVGARSNGR